MAGVYRPDTCVADFVKRKDISYKELLVRMSGAFSGLKKRRKLPAGHFDRYQGIEMLRKMKKFYSERTYRRYVKYMFEFIEAHGSEFTTLVARLGLSLSEAEGVEDMFQKGGYRVVLSKTEFTTGASAVSSKPAPSASTTGASAVSSKPTPSASTTGASAVSSKPTPSASTTGASAVSSKPAPSASTTGASAVSSKPAPSASTTGASAVSSKPAPSASTTDASAVSSKPAPSASTTGASAVSSKPAPSASTTGASAVSSKPAPSASTTGASAVSSKPAPSASTTGVSAVSSKPAPSASTTGASAVSSKPAPSASTTGASAVSSKPAPSASTTGASAVSSKPAPSASTTGASAVSSTLPAVAPLIPAHWSCPIDLVGHRKVDLAPDSDEYNTVMQFLNQTKSESRRIAKITRIENPYLWRQFQTHKEYVALSCPPKTEIVRKLYHGTPSANLDSILSSGFDRTFSGVTGTTYGRGTYFSTIFGVSASKRYARDGELLLCDVVVGESVLADSSHRVLPFKPNFPGIRYNSAANSLNKPSVFVIYADAAVYPTYLINLGTAIRHDNDL